MRLDDAKSSWRSGDDSFDDAMSERELLSRVKRRSNAFDDTIRKRDRRELIAAGLVCLFFLWFFLFVADPSGLTQVGVLLVVAGSVLSAWMLRRARRRTADQYLGLPLADVLRFERAKVDAQIRLLRTVLWWYVAPIGIGVILIVAGLRGGSWFTAIYAAVVVVVGAGIYHLNQQAVQRRLSPRRDELTRLLRQLEE